MALHMCGQCCSHFRYPCLHIWQADVPNTGHTVHTYTVSSLKTVSTLTTVKAWNYQQLGISLAHISCCSTWRMFLIWRIRQEKPRIGSLQLICGFDLSSKTSENWICFCPLQKSGEVHKALDLNLDIPFFCYITWRTVQKSIIWLYHCHILLEFALMCTEWPFSLFPTVRVWFISWQSYFKIMIKC